ncbi:MAG: DUF362 domain-containing protein [bacterium]
MKPVSRRSFLKGALLTGVAAGLRGGSLSGEEAPLRERPRVVDVQGPLESALDVLLRELGGLGRFVKEGSTVLIKPNMSFPNPPEQATTTDPALIRSLIARCLEAGAQRVLVADHPLRSAGLCAELTGIRDACAGIREAHLIVASQESMFQRVTLSGTRQLREVRILRAALQSDVQINLPRMKSHGATTVSLGTKGNMGLIWDRGIFHGSLDLNEAIADLNTRIRADLTILDGSRVLTAGGPLGPGPVEQLGCLIGGTDPVAVDAYGISKTRWYDRAFEPHEVSHLVACHGRGLGEIDLGRVEVISQRVPAS